MCLLHVPLAPALWLWLLFQHLLKIIAVIFMCFWFKKNDCNYYFSPLSAEAAYHSLEDGGVVEYCTTIIGDSAPTVVAAVETPVEMLAPAASASPSQPPSLGKPQELKSRIALNSARLLQEQRVTNVHIRQIAQHLESQNELLQMMRRSQEAQALAQERQAQALEGTQAALLALVQMLRPALKELRKSLQSGTEMPNNSSSSAATAEAAADRTSTDEQNTTQTSPPETQNTQDTQ